MGRATDVVLAIPPEGSNEDSNAGSNTHNDAKDGTARKAFWGTDVDGLEGRRLRRRSDGEDRRRSRLSFEFGDGRMHLQTARRSTQELFDLRGKSRVVVEGLVEGPDGHVLGDRSAQNFDLDSPGGYALIDDHIELTGIGTRNLRQDEIGEWVDDGVGVGRHDRVRVEVDVGNDRRLSLAVLSLAHSHGQDLVIQQVPFNVAVLVDGDTDRDSKGEAREARIEGVGGQMRRTVRSGHKVQVGVVHRHGIVVRVVIAKIEPNVGIVTLPAVGKGDDRVLRQSARRDGHGRGRYGRRRRVRGARNRIGHSIRGVDIGNVHTSVVGDGRHEISGQSVGLARVRVASQIRCDVVLRHGASDVGVDGQRNSEAERSHCEDRVHDERLRVVRNMLLNLESQDRANSLLVEAWEHTGSRVVGNGNLHRVRGIALVSGNVGGDHHVLHSGLRIANHPRQRCGRVCEAVVAQVAIPSRLEESRRRMSTVHVVQRTGRHVSWDIVRALSANIEKHSSC